MPVFKKNKSFFLTNPAPLPHAGWTIAAFREYCRAELEELGFDLKRPLSCAYDHKSGDMVFWQESTVVPMSYSVN